MRFSCLMFFYIEKQRRKREGKRLSRRRGGKDIEPYTAGHTDAAVRLDAGLRLGRSLAKTDLLSVLFRLPSARLFWASGWPNRADR